MRLLDNLQKQMNAKIASILMLLSAVTVSASFETGSFTDGFEAATIDPSWTKINQNTTTTLQASVVHSGAQAVQFTTTTAGQKQAHLEHVFAQKQYGTVSVWVRDPKQYIYFSLGLSNTDTGSTWSIGVQDWDYSAYYSVAGKTSFARTVGWHRFVIEMGETSIRALIDGQVVYSGAGGQQFNKVALNMSGPGSTGTVYFDDFVFESWLKPVIEGFTPASGLVGSSVTITGSNFTGATAVRFGGVDATSFTTDSATQITATVPNGAQTGPITVVSAFGSAASAGDFTVTRLAQSISFDPISDKRLSTISFLPNATASSGLPVSYESSNPAVATVSGNAVILVGRGTTTITASQTGNEIYQPASSVDQPLTVIGGTISLSTPDEAALDSALAGRYDTVAFACDGTITLTTTKVISADLTLDATGHNLTLSGGSVLRPLQVESGVQLTLRGMTIANGNAITQAGGILNNGGSVTALDCTFSNNQCSGETGGTASGGAIANLAGGSLELTNCTFTQNRAVGGTGAAGAYGGNTGVAGGNGYGGAIYQNGGTIQLTNCTFHTNGATGGIGGAGGNGVDGWQYWVKTGIWSGYWATVPGGPGGQGGNGGSGYGGSLHNASGTVVMLNVTMASGASLGGNGGAPGYPGLYGTGNYGYGSYGTNNQGSNIAGSAGSVTLENTIIAYGTSVPNCSGNILDGGYNLSSDATPAFSATTSHNSINPMLTTSPADNGGPTATLALTGASPAINSGNDATAPVCDQRGLPRVGGASDIGSFEYQLLPEITGFTPDNGTVGSEVVITGNNFISITEVLIGGVSAGFTIDSANQITAVIPSGAQNGAISISARVGAVASGSAFTVIRLPQSIDFGALANRRIDSGDFELSAVASSGLPVIYESSNTDVATVTGTSVVLTGRGSVSITARQAGNEVYLPAVEVVRSFDVTGIPPVIGSFSPSSSTIAVAAEGDVLPFSISATDPEPVDVITHTWFVSTDAGATWLPLAAAGSAPAITIPYEIVQHPATSLSGGMFRIKSVLSDGFGGNAEQIWTVDSITDRNRLPGFQRAPGEGAWGWRATSTNGAPLARNNPTEVWTGSKAIFWGGDVGSDSPLNTGGLYDPLTDSWKPVSLTNAPAPRMSHTALWTGSGMIVWGGDQSGWSYSTGRLNSGGIYHPSTDTWTSTSTTDAPAARARHTAVWTGGRMIVWGGTINTGSYYTTATDTGGVYNPENNTWTAVTMSGAPTRRFGHRSVWTGSRMLVWGGQREGNSTYIDTNTGGIYDPVTDSWSPMSTVNAPPTSVGSSHVWTGSHFIVWGGGSGANSTNMGWSYHPATDQWTSLSTANAPSARCSYEEGGDAIWTENRMLVWGGVNSYSEFTRLLTGGLYDPTTDTWRTMETLGTHSARYCNGMVWAGTSAIVWAGYSISNTRLDTGAVYAAAPDVKVVPVHPLTGQELMCSLEDEALDPDSEDQANLSYEFAWLRNGIEYVTHATNISSDTLPAGTTAAGESWTCRVTVRDSSSAATPQGISSPVVTESRPPGISGFSPVNGPVGSQVVITGRDFVNVTSVTIGGANASFTMESDTRITLTVPVGFTCGLIKVFAQLGTATSETDFVATTTFADWRVGKFTTDGLADPAISGDQATPAHDGISNLMKYALALEPMVCGSADLPYPDKQDGYLTLTYRQNKQAGDITFTVEAGDSLTGNGWQPATTEVSRADGGDYWLVTVQDNTPISSSQCRFMRLKVGR